MMADTNNNTMVRDVAKSYYSETQKRKDRLNGQFNSEVVHVVEEIDARIWVTGVGIATNPGGNTE